MNEKIDVVLIKPGGRVKLFGQLADSSGFAPPLDIGLYAAFLRDRGFGIRVIDVDCEALTPEETADRVTAFSPLLCAIFSHTIRMSHASLTAALLKKKAPKIKILFGGRHPSALPEMTLSDENPDFVCQGEAFYPLTSLLEKLKSGKDDGEYKIDGLWYKKDGRIFSNPPAALIQNLDVLPFIAWDLLPVEKYRAHNWQCFDHPEIRQPYGIIYSSIGCPFSCSYCCVNTTYGRPGIRYRSPEKVIAEIDLLVKKYNVRIFRIVDDNFTMRRDRVLELCDLIIGRGYKDLNFWCYSRIDTVDEEMLARMKQAGIRWICIGLEAGHEAVREGVYKKIAPEKMQRGIRMMQESGINIIANFIFGLPDDDMETMRRTLSMAIEFNFEYVNFYVAMAWPGSGLYSEAVKNGVRLPETWEGYAQLSEETLPLPTKHIPASEVLRFRDQAFVEYFSRKEYLEMLEKKFNKEVPAQIKKMLGHSIKRKYA